MNTTTHGCVIISRYIQVRKESGMCTVLSLFFLPVTFLMCMISNKYDIYDIYYTLCCPSVTLIHLGTTNGYLTYLRVVAKSRTHPLVEV